MVEEKNKILVIEDEVDDAKQIKHQLINLGFDRPYIINSAKDAIECLKNDSFDLILINSSIDGEPNIKVSQEIQEQSGLPIIFISNVEFEKLPVINNEIKPFQYLKKPIILQELENAINYSININKQMKKKQQIQKGLFTTLQTLGHAIITVDLNQQITFLNKNAERFIGIPSSDCVNKPINNILKTIDAVTYEPFTLSIDKNQIIESKEIKTVRSHLILQSNQGTKIVIYQSIAPLYNYKGDLEGYVIIFQDITEQSDAYTIFQKITKELERRVEKRTQELQVSNKKLQSQIKEREKAEEKANYAKQSIENITNSTSEIIFALDAHQRVEYWNTAAENITGYKKKQVNGRYLLKLPLLDNPEKINTILEKVTVLKKTIKEKVVIITKNYSKKILNITCTPLITEQDSSGFVFVGNDITYNWEDHNMLLPSYSYLLTGNELNSSLHLFTNLLLNKYNGVYITRCHPKQVNSKIPHENTTTILLRQESSQEEQMTISTLTDLVSCIRDFAKNNRIVIYIDGIHYFLTRYSFTEVMNCLYQINDIISNSQALLLLYADPIMFSQNEIAIMKNEFETMPSKKIDHIEIKEELFDILKYIHNENMKNTLVSFSKIMSHFDIVYYTASKRIKNLFDEGLVFTKKYGKTRVVHLTEKGKTLLAKRDVL